MWSMLMVIWFWALSLSTLQDELWGDLEMFNGVVYIVAHIHIIDEFVEGKFSHNSQDLDL